MNKFNFREACRRVICGNNHILRAGWPVNYSLRFIINDAVFMVNDGSGVIILLTQDDIDAKDWIDPGE